FLDGSQLAAIAIWYRAECAARALVSYGATLGTPQIRWPGHSPSNRGASAGRCTRLRRRATFPGRSAWSYIATARSWMSKANRLATSTMKTEAEVDRRAFVTLRFAGDDLDPGEIAAVLPIAPTRAHRKGEEFFAGAHAGKLRGRTGIWFLATDRL